MGTCKGICGYNLVYNFDVAFTIKNLVFVVHFLNAFWHGNETLCFLEWGMKLFLSLQPFTCHIVNKRVWKYVSTSVVIKIKTFHSCRTCVICVALVLYSCHTCIALALLVLHSCCIRVARVALVSLVSGIRFIN